MRINSTKTNIKGKTTEVTFTVNDKEYTRKVKKGLISFKTKKYFIYDYESLREVPERVFNFSTFLGWDGYEKDLNEIVSFYSDKSKDDSESRPNGNGLITVYRGMIEVRKNHTIHGGTYGFDSHLPYAVIVGSNVDNEISKKIETEVAYVSRQYKGLTIGGNQPRFRSKYGTAFSTYGLGA